MGSPIYPRSEPAIQATDSQILAAIKSKLSSLTTVASNKIFSGKILNYQVDDLPALNIFIPSETSQITNDRGVYENIKQVEIHIVASGASTEEADTSADDILTVLSDILNEIKMTLLNQLETLNVDGVATVNRMDYTGYSDTQPDKSGNHIYITRLTKWNVYTKDGTRSNTRRP